MSPPVYLDHNATTPPHEDVLAAMHRAWSTGWANPSSLHRAGRQARRLVEEAREAVAALAGLHPRDVTFTSGGTEANNLAIERPFRLGDRGLLLTSRLEHPSLLACAEDLERRGVRVHWIEPLPGGHLPLDAFASVLARREPGEPTLLATHAVHHETGAIQPIPELAALAESHGAQLHVDAVQAAGRIDPALWRGAHSVALAAHKLRGPKGIGALVTRPGLPLHPLLRGGSQERGFRPGTLDPIAAAGFAVAAHRALHGGPERYATLRPLRDALEQKAVAEAARLGIQIDLTGREPRAPHVAHLLVAGWRGDELVAALDLEGICVSSGSACSAGTAEPSPAIAALVGIERARSALRVSLGETSTMDDVAAFLKALQRVLGRAR
ncbi:MAG: cysteine desulfurase family protein [Myxococcales bacterium]|nr:cysteine desulfurase [Polyangiaceae bacterium]MDW8248556.1 cysteine desulfurase family protein [Myxococcales bacterium]